MILALGGQNAIELRWTYGRRMRLATGRVAHAAGGQGRRLCWTTLYFRDAPPGKAVVPFGDGPHGYSTLGTFRCETCRAVMDIYRSGLRFHSAPASFTARAKRGLRVIR